MEIKFDDAPGVYRCVPIEEVASRTYNGGWALVAIVQNQVVEQVVEQVPRDANEQPGPHNNYGSSKFSERRVPMLITKAMAVLRQTPDDRIVEQSREMEAVQQQYNEKASRLHILEKELASAQARNKEVTASLEQSNTFRTKICEERDVAQANLRRLELDIGKIRRAIGGIEMDKILGVEKKS